LAHKKVIKKFTSNEQGPLGKDLWSVSSFVRLDEVELSEGVLELSTVDCSCEAFYNAFVCVCVWKDTKPHYKQSN
jgi:hypothetical protein